MKIPTNKGSSLESAEMEEEYAENAIKGRVTKAVKKAQIQNTIPMFIELKRLLESKNNPLTGSLMECLRILLKDYKNEINEMLVHLKCFADISAQEGSLSAEQGSCRKIMHMRGLLVHERDLDPFLGNENYSSFQGSNGPSVPVEDDSPVEEATFRKFHDENVTKEWLDSVPRLIADNETSIQEECENLFLELVLDQISRAGSNANLLERDQDEVLSLLKEICHGEVNSWVKKICTNLGKKSKLKPKVAISLQNIIRKPESVWLAESKPIEKWLAPAGPWFLLSEVSGYLLKAVDWEFLYHHWQLLDKHESINSPPAAEEEEEAIGVESNSVDWAGNRVALLQTISNVSVELPAEPAADLAHNLLKRIEEFNMHSMEVDAHVKALRTLCKRKAKDPEEADALVIKWVHQLLAKASKTLEKYMTKASEISKESNLFTPPSGTRTGLRSSKTMPRLLAKAVTAVYTIGSLVIVCPTCDIKSIVPILHNIITSGITDPKLKKASYASVSIKQTAPSLYIQAWLTTGKICLADDKLAKRYIPLFVQEMENSNDAALRNNIIVMMADFCVRYTALIDW
ncbi:condensin-2 complex subunit D3 [Tanacetum coccineum]